MTSIPLSPLRIPSETHVLGNGLAVVVHEDRSAPVVAVHVMYHVGSKDEQPGSTGLAHLLEHLLFEGSLNCPKGEFDRMLERVGGSNNGSTWLDRTNYYEVVPSHAVETALWLERERMAFFLPVLDEEMLELQRDVVMNERRQAYENRPYGMADERMHQLLFGDRHPYSWPTIGYMSDLERIDLQEARDFFERFYAPANAVLVLAGDVAPDEAVRLAERYFGDLPSGERPHRNGAPPAAAAVCEDEVLLDRVTFPRIYLNFTTSGYGTDDWVAADVLTYLLGDGESSRLQRALVREKQLARDVDTFLYPTELAGIGGIVATARSGVSPDRLAAAIRQVLVEIVERGVEEEEELLGAVRRARRDHVGSLATVEDRAEELAYAATVLGSADELERVLAAYANVTPERLRSAAEHLLAPDGVVRLTVLPSDRRQDARG